MIRLLKMKLVQNTKNKNQVVEELTFKSQGINVVGSSDNQDGKTSRRKMIIYSLGFNVTFPKPLSIKKYKVLTLWEIEGKKIWFERSKKNKGDILEISDDDEMEIFSSIYKGKFNLLDKMDYQRFIPLFKNLFQITPMEFAYLLKAFYVDQDKGYWKKSLETIVTEKYSFDLRKFISIVNEDSEVEALFEKIKIENRRRVECSRTLNIMKKISMIPTGVTMDDGRIDDIKKEIFNLSEENKVDFWSLTRFKKYGKDSTRVFEEVEKLKIILRIEGRDIPFSKDLVKKNEIKDSFMKYEISRLENQIKNREEKIQEKTQEIDLILKSQNKAASEYYEKISNKIHSQIQITQEEVDFLEADKKSLDKKIKDLSAEINENTDGMLDEMKVLTEKMLHSFKSKNTKFSFVDSYRHNSHKSGVEQVFLTISILFSLNSIVRERLGFDFPIIIDAPEQQELHGTESSKRFSRVLVENFKERQVIIFSNTIQKTFEETQNNYNSLKITKIEEKLL